MKGVSNCRLQLVYRQRKTPSVPIVQEAGWAQGLGCALWRRGKFVAYAGEPTPIPRLFNHYTYLAIPIQERPERHRKKKTQSLDSGRF